MDTMVNAAKRDAGSTQHLQDLLGQDILVPAKTVGLSDLEQFLPGKVVDINTEDNSLWCTVSGDKRWYRWHMEDVRSWLLAPGKRSIKACSMPASDKDHPTSRRLLQSPPGKSQRPHLAGSKPRPHAPGPEQLWKYCKRCNSWKERPGDFSKNHRTPDGLQFYCRFCHNRMTKFNQQRRLENRHIAEKHHLIKSPPRKGPPARTAVARASHASSTSRSPSSHSRESLGFDVISSKIPRQQRTHAIYRKDSDPASSTGPSPHRQQPLKSPSPNRYTTAPQPARQQRSLGSDNGISHPGSHATSKQQQVQQLFKPKPQRSSSAQARASAELMLQANAVLQELDQSLLQAVEAASAEFAASTAQAASRHDSRAELQLPVSPSAKAPRSPVVARAVSSASPRACMQSPQRDCSRLGPRGSLPPGPPSPPPQPLQHRSSSVPAQQLTGPPSSTHTLSHSLAQLRQACCVDPVLAHNTDKQEQHQRSEQLAQQPTSRSLGKGETPAAQSGLDAAEHAVPDAASQPLSDTHELKQRYCHAESSKQQASPGRSKTGGSHMSQDRPVQGPPEDQSPLPDLAGAPLGETGSTAAVGLADLTKAETEALGRSPPKTTSSPPGPTQGAAVDDGSSVPSPPAAPTPPGLDPRTSPEPAEPSLKKRKIPRLAAPSEARDEPGCITLDPVENGSPNGTADADGSCGRQPLHGAQRAADKTSACTTADQAPDLPSATAASQHGKRPIAGSSLVSLPTVSASLPVGNGSLPIGSVSLPIGTLPTPSGESPPPTAPVENLGAIINTLSQCTSHQQLQAFFLELQARGNCQQVLQELEKHFKSACQNPSSLFPGAAPLLSTAPPPPCMATAAAARPQLQPASAASGPLAPFGTNPSKLCRSGTSAPLPLPKKAAKKRSRPESSNASLEATINSLRSDTNPAPSTLSDSQIFPLGTFPSSGLTANMPLTAFSSSAAVRLVLLAGATGSQGIPGTSPASGSPATSFGAAGAAAASSGAGAAGPASGAALELSLLLTTLQSLAQLPGEQGQPINLIASSSQVAEAHLRDWLRQLQQHAANAPGEVSAAQQSQEDAVIAAQVRREMWGNMQSIVAMLAGQGCSPHVQDMVHQIAVHFANEQSQSVALERRMTSNLSREKDVQKQLQQQLRGGIQVLSSLQKVLGAVRMQQQRAKSALDQSANGKGCDSHSMSQLRQRVAQAESGEATAQQAVRALQKKEASWEAELGAAQASNAQLHSQVAQLRQEKAALQKENDKHAHRWEKLAREVSDSEDSPRQQYAHGADEGQPARS